MDGVLIMLKTGFQSVVILIDSLETVQLLSEPEEIISVLLSSEELTRFSEPKDNGASDISQWRRIK